MDVSLVSVRTARFSIWELRDAAREISEKLNTQSQEGNLSGYSDQSNKQCIEVILNALTDEKQRVRTIAPPQQET